jgi:hypothetical protein
MYRDPTLDPAVNAPRLWQLLIWQTFEMNLSYTKECCIGS